MSTALRVGEMRVGVIIRRLFSPTAVAKEGVS